MKRIFYTVTLIAFTATPSLRAWHDAGSPIRSTAGLQWTELTWKDAPTAVKDWSHKPVILPEKNALTVRAQFWLDALDGSLRAQYGKAMASVPKPIAVVIRNPSANAYVLDQESCIQIPVSIETVGPLSSALSGTPPSGPNSMSRFINKLKLSSSDAGQSYSACVHNRQSDVTAADIQSFFKPKLKHCQIERAGIQLIFKDVPGDAERCAEGIETKTLANGVSWSSMLNLVFVHSGMFSESTSDADLVVTLAHELGHYYRAQHLHDRYSYFYELAPNGIANHPKAVADSKELLKEYSKLEIDLPLGLSEKSTLKPTLQNWLLASAPGLFTASQECVKAAAYATDAEFKTQVLRFLSEDHALSSPPMTEAGEGLYLKYETDALACLKSIPIDAADSPTQNAAYNSLSRTLSDSGALISQALFSPGKNFTDVLTSISENLTRHEENVEIFLQKISDRKLGLYTEEQEADDMEVELSYRVGFTAKEIINAELSFHKISEQEKRTANRPGQVFAKPLMADCERMLQNDWKDSPYVGIGRLDDDHHGGCFRVFNVSQEIKAHRYRQYPRVASPAPAFKELSAIAKTLHSVQAI